MGVSESVGEAVGVGVGVESCSRAVTESIVVAKSPWAGDFMFFFFRNAKERDTKRRE